MDHTRQWFLAVLAAAAMAMTSAAPAVAEEHEGGGGGPSTPCVAVLAQEPGTSGNLRMTLAGRTSSAGEPVGSLVLRVDGVRVVGYDVHRIAVGDTGCGGDEVGEVAGAEHEGDGDRAVVRGVGTLGASAFGLPAGSAVQVWIDLVDRGSELYGDDARVRIRPAPHGGEQITPVLDNEADEPCQDSGRAWSFDSSWQPIQQVQTRVLPGSAP